MALNSYTHTQAQPSNLWDITHNLGTYPIVDVIVSVEGTLTKVVPKSVLIVDMNRVQVMFDAAQSGVAKLI